MIVAAKIRIAGLLIYFHKGRKGYSVGSGAGILTAVVACGGSG